MNKYKSIDEFKKTVQRITEAETNDFFELAEMLGRDLKTDLAGANLNGVNLSGGNLRGANLRQTDLSGADLSQTDLSGADLTKANLSCASLIGTNLTATNLSDAKLEYARFSINQGLSESMKLDLSRRGAIFDDDHSKEEEDINLKAFNKQKKTLLKKYKGEYVAFVEGELKDNDKSKSNLSTRVYLQYPDQPKFIEKVEEKVIYMEGYGYNR